MQFEFCMRRVFGDDARHIAESCLDDDCRKTWVIKFIKQLIRNAQDPDTTQEHREHVSALLQGLLKDKWTGDQASWHIVFDTLILLAELMGYRGSRGVRAYLPMYWQSLDTHLIIENDRGNTEQLQNEFKSAAAHRTEVVQFLKDKGLTDFEVAMAMKTSEYEVKKLKRGI
ncbi:MAG: hypothetical protein JXR40_01145 [Pontiellaceae bacterium]|nr:hypothetical protein [Pontiellaceae bacterium]